MNTLEETVGDRCLHIADLRGAFTHTILQVLTKERVRPGRSIRVEMDPRVVSEECNLRRAFHELSFLGEPNGKIAAVSMPTRLTTSPGLLTAAAKREVGASWLPDLLVEFYLSWK